MTLSASSNVFEVTSAITNSTLTVLTLKHSTSGVAANGFGDTVYFQAEDDGGTNRNLCAVQTWWQDAASATRSANFDIWLSSQATLRRAFSIFESGISTVFDTVIGFHAALATNTTGGFLYIPSCAGAPTGVPTAYTGKIPLIIDSTNLAIYAYIGGAWKHVHVA